MTEQENELCEHFEKFGLSPNFENTHIVKIWDKNDKNIVGWLSYCWGYLRLRKDKNYDEIKCPKKVILIELDNRFSSVRTFSSVKKEQEFWNYKEQYYKKQNLEKYVFKVYVYQKGDEVYPTICSNCKEKDNRPKAILIELEKRLIDKLKK